MELDDKQLEILEDDYPQVVVMASAGSGKTRLITERIKRDLANGHNPEGMVAITFTNNAAAEMRERLGKGAEKMFIGTVHSYANQLLTHAGVDTSSCIRNEDFNKLFELIKTYPSVLNPVDKLYLDEAQDSDQAQFNFMFDYVYPTEFFVVGDIRQCQPQGTLVQLADRTVKPIEEIKVGDNIRGYSFNDDKKNDIKKVTNVQKRPFNYDTLITITSASGRKSSYTPNHKTFIQFNDIEDKYIVYLTTNGQEFKVGHIPTAYLNEATHQNKDTNSWWRAMNDGHYSQLWLLKICDTKDKALTEEQQITKLYNISSFENTDMNNSSYFIPTTKQLLRCLDDYQLDIQYPFFDFNLSWSATGRLISNTPLEIYAKNIMPHHMSCLVLSTEDADKQAEHITHIDNTYIINPISVYSLEVEGGVYIADEIITHNSIYSFNGADYTLMEKLAKQKGVRAYSLNYNYRCGATILDYSRKLLMGLPHIFHDNSISRASQKGEVFITEGTMSDIPTLIEQDGEYGRWFVLCRYNREIHFLENLFNYTGIPYINFRQGDLSNEELNLALNSPKVKLLTIHSAKGLGADKVIVYGARYSNAEEKRVSYVAATRARQLLVWIKPKKKWKRNP